MFEFGISKRLRNRNVKVKWFHKLSSLEFSYNFDFWIEWPLYSSHSYPIKDVFPFNNVVSF